MHSVEDFTISSVGRKGWPRGEEGAVRLLNLQQAAAHVGVEILTEAEAVSDP